MKYKKQKEVDKKESISTVGDHLHIVLGGEHYNPLGIIRSLGEAGIRSVAIIIKGKKCFVGSSKYISEAIHTNGIDEAINVLLSRYGNMDNKPFVYITDDYFLEYVDGHYDELKDMFIFANAGKTGRITYYSQKDNINQIAYECGMTIPKSEVVENGVLPQTLSYPVITKAISSTSGAWKADSFICHSESELEEAFGKIKGKTLLIQEFIEREAEFNIDGISVDHGNSIFLSMKTQYVYLLPGRYSNYMDVSNPDNKYLDEKIKQIIKKIGYEGIFDGEFMIGKDGEIYFLEINFRPNAFNYASTCAGMNGPYLWAKGMIDGTINEENYTEIPKGFRAMVENMDFKDRVIAGKTNILKWIVDFLSCDCHFFLNIHDIKPFIKAFILK